MSWSNLFVIFRREVLDQVRDRRTLFMIFVFPILLYPILGYGIIQATAAQRKSPGSLWWWGPSIFPPRCRC